MKSPVISPPSPLTHLTLIAHKIHDKKKSLKKGCPGLGNFWCTHRPCQTRHIMTLGWVQLDPNVSVLPATGGKYHIKVNILTQS